jgi:hypothetical protein
MAKAIRMSCITLSIVMLGVPGWVLAEPDGTGNTSSKENPNQSRALDNQATDTKETQGSNQSKLKEDDPAAGGTDRPTAAGPMGEASVGGSGPSGPSALPPGPAPGYEGGQPSSKR